MRHLPLNWSEGMFLRPHHFQAAERHWQECLAISQQWDHPYSYGLMQIEISREAIANFQIEVRACQARLRDGTLVVLTAGDELDRVDLRLESASRAASWTHEGLEEAFADEDTVRVYLAVPRVRMGRANLSIDAHDGQQRYAAVPLEVPDENLGGNEQPLEFRTLNVRILLSTQDLTGYEVLPIAEVRRASATDASPHLVETYFPPVLALETWPELATGIIRGIYDIVGEHIRLLHRQVESMGIRFSSQEPGHVDRLHLLSVLNEASASLHGLTFSKGVHPWTAYCELCRLVGRLAIFTPDKQLPDLPPYDHDNLGYVFIWIRDQLLKMLSRPRDDFEQRYFVGSGRGMQVSFEPEWLRADWEWHVGVNPGVFPANDCAELLSKNNMDWKLGASDRVDQIYRVGSDGVRLIRAARTPDGLPTHGGWLYYQVSRDSSAWDEVEASQTLAMRFNENLILNLRELSGQRKVNVRAADRVAVLEFALFAKRRR